MLLLKSIFVMAAQIYYCLHVHFVKGGQIAGSVVIGSSRSAMRDGYASLPTLLGRLPEGAITEGLVHLPPTSPSRSRFDLLASHSARPLCDTPVASAAVQLEASTSFARQFAHRSGTAEVASACGAADEQALLWPLRCCQSARSVNCWSLFPPSPLMILVSTRF